VIDFIRREIAFPHAMPYRLETKHAYGVECPVGIMPVRITIAYFDHAGLHRLLDCFRGEVTSIRPIGTVNFVNEEEFIGSELRDQESGIRDIAQCAADSAQGTRNREQRAENKGTDFR
jgi:hypothetical protein